MLSPLSATLHMRRARLMQGTCLAVRPAQESGRQGKIQKSTCPRCFKHPGGWGGVGGGGQTKAVLLLVPGASVLRAQHHPPF